MKKLFLSSLAVVIVVISHAQQAERTEQAQIKKGTVFIGGNIGFSNQTAKSSDTLYLAITSGAMFNINPSFGLAIKDNLVFGINLGYGYQKNNYYSSSPAYYNKLNQYSAGVFLRKYKALGSGFSIFGQASLSYSYSKNTYSPSDGVQLIKNYGESLSFYPGIAYTFCHHWQLETSLTNLLHVNYNHSNQIYQVPNSSKAQTTYDTFNYGSSLGTYFQFSVGVLYVI